MSLADVSETKADKPFLSFVVLGTTMLQRKRREGFFSRKMRWNCPDFKKRRNGNDATACGSGPNGVDLRRSGSRQDFRHPHVKSTPFGVGPMGHSFQ